MRATTGRTARTPIPTGADRADATASADATPVTIPLSATDLDNNPLTLRVLKQTSHGRVTISGRTATYYPDPGLRPGLDVFTFVARDAAIDSNRGTVRITRSASAGNYGTGYPGTGGVVPSFTATRPVLGSTATLTLQNSSGGGVPGVLLLSTERSNRPPSAARC